MKKAVLTAIGAGALCGVLAIAAPAQASVVLNGGVTGTAPTNPGSNDLFNPLYGVASVSGWYYGDLSNNPPASANFVYGALELTQASKITFTYLGKEAGFSNAFQIDTGSGWTTLISKPGTPSLDTTTQGLGTYQFSAGIIPFRFVSNGGSNIATNGGTGVGLGYTSQASIFVTFLDAATNKPLANQAKGPGNVVANLFDVFYDDSGANNDDNHDDFAIRFAVTPVPVPAALPILAAALAGFGFAGYRSRRDA